MALTWLARGRTQPTRPDPQPHSGRRRPSPPASWLPGSKLLLPAQPLPARARPSGCRCGVQPGTGCFPWPFSGIPPIQGSTYPPPSAGPFLPPDEPSSPGTSAGRRSPRGTPPPTRATCSSHSALGQDFPKPTPSMATPPHLGRRSSPLSTRRDSQPAALFLGARGGAL